MNYQLEASPSAISEQSVIGCILLDESTVHIAREMLKPDDFYFSINRKIYTEMLHLSESGQEINLASVLGRLVFDDEFNKQGGVDILTNSTTIISSAAFIETYANRVKKEAVRRKLSLFADGIKDITSKPIEDIGAVISSLGDSLFDLNDYQTNTPWRTFSELVCSACERMIDKSGGDAVKTGYIDLDRMIGGFKPGELAIVAARPAMGKTAFGLNIMTNAMVKDNMPIAFFSLEMTGEELMNRVLSNLASVNGDLIKNQTLNDEEWNRVLSSAEKYSRSKIYVDETPAIDIATLRDRSKRMHKQFGIKLIIVDYLQLMRSEKKKVQNREQEVADVSRTLKAVAKELHIPIIALSQLNRNVDARAEKRPVMSDLRESGSIEQDADKVMFIHREDYYRPNAEQNHEAEIIIAKQRNGPTGIVKLRWTGEYTRFETLDNQF